MERFIRDQNIRLFRAKLAETTDPAERDAIRKLLAEEEARLADTAKSTAAPRTSGGGA